MPSTDAGMAHHRVPPGPPQQPSAWQTREGRARLAVWQADVAGLDWIDHLVHEGNAVSFGGNGYPMRYAARANGVIPVILGGPPLARALWQREAEDIVTPAWAGKTVIEQATIDACRPAEWLLIEAWDES